MLLVLLAPHVSVSGFPDILMLPLVFLAWPGAVSGFADFLMLSFLMLFA